MKGTRYLKKISYILSRRFKPRAIVLLYHRVANLPSNPYSLAITPEHFAQQLEYIQHTCHPMRLLDLVDAMQQRSLPQRAVAITFDDGYCDNHNYAFPLLKSAGIPATIFVASQKINNAQEFWWDDLERILLIPQCLPEYLRISIHDQIYEWHFQSLEERRQAHKSLHKLLRPLDTVIREKVLADLASWAKLEPAGRSDYRAMTVTELVELAQSDCIEIGGHTITHPQLSALSSKAQYAEIDGGRRAVESLIGKRVMTFAYPYGTAQDFTPETVQVVRTIGFRTACTTTPGYIKSGDDPYELRRCPVFDWDQTEFKQQLESYFLLRA